jgi:hypothetical protein
MTQICKIAVNITCGLLEMLQITYTIPSLLHGGYSVCIVQILLHKYKQGFRRDCCA